MKRYFIHLAYKGTNYCGWQIQSGQNSVQQEIEYALTKLNSNKKIEITGCGRTDTGVHAHDFYAHFDSEIAWDIAQLVYKLNLILPDDIAVFSVCETNSELHARFSAISRSYEYRIHVKKDPFISEISWYQKLNLDVEKINEACRLILAHTNFECFSKVHTDVTNFNCTIHHCEWMKTENGFVFKISANRFLRNMVRAITGTLIEVGNGKISLDDFKKILDSNNRSMAGVSVPAHGLSLVRVVYPEGSFKN